MLVGSDYTVLRSRSLHLLYPPFLSVSSLPSLPLEVGPKFSYRGLSIYFKAKLHPNRSLLRPDTGGDYSAPADLPDVFKILREGREREEGEGREGDKREEGLRPQKKFSGAAIANNIGNCQLKVGYCRHYVYTENLESEYLLAVTK